MRRSEGSLIRITAEGSRLKLTPSRSLMRIHGDWYRELTVGTMLEWRHYGGDMRDIWRMIVAKLRGAKFSLLISTEAQELLRDKDFERIMGPRLTPHAGPTIGPVHCFVAHTLLDIEYLGKRENDT